MSSKSRCFEDTIYSPCLGFDWNYTVYLPAGYDDEENKDRRYPVLYFLHGAFGNHTNIVERCQAASVLDKFIDAGDIPPAIAVFVDGFNAYYIDGIALHMESAIVKDLIPQMETLYRADARRACRYLAGLSMGGFGAARLALKYPELFGFASLWSPVLCRMPEEDGTIRGRWHAFSDGTSNFSEAVWLANYPQAYFDSYREKKLPVRFFIRTGKIDECVSPETICTFADELAALADVDCAVIDGYGHSWPFWKKCLKESLKAWGEGLSICPVCGSYIFEEKYEICPVCGWENDPVQTKDPDLCGGANEMSAKQAHKAFLKGETVK